MTRTTLLLISALTLLGCPAEPAPTPTPPAKDAAPSPADPQRQHAVASAKAMGTQLKQRLQAAIKSGGLGAGIKACKLEAPRIAADVSAQQRVRVGRTSFKLRNPNNTAPAWAEGWVKQRVAEPRFQKTQDGTLQALLPIKLEALCVTCHGAPERLPDLVRSTLAAEYPDDQATGFAPGDLRGWFWIEVPPPQQAD